MSRTFTQTVHVEVDLEEFGDDEIEKEYEARGLGSGGPHEAIEEMFYAFKLGRDERAIELAKQIAQDVMGRILP